MILGPASDDALSEESRRAKANLEMRLQWQVCSDWFA